MLGKKGQIVFFIVLAVAILAAGAFYFAYSPEPSKGLSRLSTDADSSNVKSFVEACLKSAAEEGIYFLSLQGGYYHAPELSVNFSFIRVPYYWHLASEMLPKKDVLERELSKFIEDALPVCINNFTAFKEVGYAIGHEKPKIVSKIAEKNVFVEADFPVIIVTGSSANKINSFASIVNINLNWMYGHARQIIEEQGKNADAMSLGFMAEQAYNNNFTFEYIYLGNGDVIYSLIFNESFGNVFVFAFAAKYNWSNATISQPISVSPIPEFNLTEPKVINYRVRASGEDLTFYDYTELFDINPKTGLISFDAFDAPNGEYDVLIKAVDKNGNEAFALMKISINYQNKLPVIEQIGNLTAYVGKGFSYNVKAHDPTNKFLFFLDDETLFDINVQTGEIKFTPRNSGNYTIKIIAVNGEGSSYEYANLEVK